MDDVVEISLANGKGVAIVDADDAPLVSAYSWRAIPDSHTTYAGARVPGTRGHVLMHRLVLGISDRRIHVDHVDGDGLNNVRSNLREASDAQNAANRRKQRGFTSRFKGVFWHKGRGHWVARIKVNGKHSYLGSFATEEDAAASYDRAAVVAFGEFARLNFAEPADPPKGDE